jgi:hypothetical protein
MTKERALIGTDACGAPIILATDSSGIRFDVSEISCLADDIGIRWDESLPPGLYLWTGIRKMIMCGHPLGAQEWDIDYTGELRRVEPHEVSELYAMTAPDPYPMDGPDDTDKAGY